MPMHMPVLCPMCMHEAQMHARLLWVKMYTRLLRVKGKRLVRLGVGVGGRGRGRSRLTPTLTPTLTLGEGGRAVLAEHAAHRGG